jgi:hypothetical protein
VKRPYREGDWFAIPLGDGRFAAGIVTHGTRKAIYGFFFGSARAAIPQVVDLAGLRPADALWSGRFSDRAIVQRRWPVIGAQPGFIRGDWGAAPPAPAAGPGLVERRLAALAAGTAFEPARLSVRDFRSPIESHAFDRIPDRVCLQWCEPLSETDLDMLASIATVKAGANLRLSGNAVAQVNALAGWVSLHRLRLESAHLPDGLARLPAVLDLELDGVPADLARTLGAFANLKTLRIRARGGAVDVSALVGAAKLEVLVLRDTALTAAASLRDLRALRVLDVESASIDDADAAFGLRLLELRLANVVPVRTLAALRDHPTLQTLALAGLIDVDDLGPIATIAGLESLDLRGFWQCSVDDVAFVASMASLRRLHLDIGGRRKNEEIYRRRSLAEPLPTGR